MIDSTSKFIDLTHTLHPNIPHWETECGFQLETKLDYSDCQTDTKFRVQYLHLYSGSGTHMDAPSHCIQNSMNIDQIPLTNLIIRPCLVIDVANRADTNYQVSIKDIEIFEQKYGIIPKQSFVLIHTGWSKYWNTSKYRNNLKFPSVSLAAAEFLVNRDIVGLGIDTLSPDAWGNGFPVHKILLGNNKYIIENIANSEKMPATGSYIIALPIKIQDATEAPIRLIGVINTDKEN